MCLIGFESDSHLDLRMMAHSHLCPHMCMAAPARHTHAAASGHHFNNGCCFDYGNAETDARDHGAGTMEAIYFGNSSGWGLSHIHSTQTLSPRA
jgi:hypothetical protein